MGTSNFFYKNRCVIVTNDDYEFGNLPELGDWIDHNNSYPAREVITDKEFKFHQITLRNGYYEHACIDYQRLTDVLYDEYFYYRFDSRNELIKVLSEDFSISCYRVAKLVGKLGDMDFSNFVERGLYAVEDYLADLEESEVNAEIDKIKADYGYDEYETEVRFSNGETWYQKVS